MLPWWSQHGQTLFLPVRGEAWLWWNYSWTRRSPSKWCSFLEPVFVPPFTTECCGGASALAATVFTTGWFRSAMQSQSLLGFYSIHYFLWANAVSSGFKLCVCDLYFDMCCRRAVWQVITEKSLLHLKNNIFPTLCLFLWWLDIIRKVDGQNWTDIM